MIVRSFIFLFYFLLTTEALASSFHYLEKITEIKAGGEYHYLVVLPADSFSSERQNNYSHNLQAETLSFVMTERDRLPEYSTGDIVATIRESRSRVVVIAEDKAAADVLESFIQYPELSEKVHSFVSVRGKVRGAEYAERARPPLDLVEVQKAEKIPLILALRALVDIFTNIFYGFDPTLYAFKPEVRQSYLKAHDLKIREISQRVQLYSVEPGRKNYGVLPYSKTIR